MGYFVPAAGDDRLAGPYADYDTALTALRADSGASDGDAYQLDNDMVFNAYVSEGPGILIPSDLYERIDAYVTNSGDPGIAHLRSADTEAEILARGWTIEEGGIATVTGGSGSPFRCDSGNSAGGTSDTAFLRFTPTTAASNVLLLIKAQTVSGAVMYQGYAAAFYDESKAVRISGTNGSVGSHVQTGTGGSPLSGSIGEVSETGAAWWLLFADQSDSGNTIVFRRLESKPEEVVSCLASQLLSTAFKACPYLGARLDTTGGQAIFDVYEAHALELT